MEMEPFFIRHAEGKRLIGVGDGHYSNLIKRGEIQTIGKGKLSRTIYSSLKEDVRRVVAEAEAKNEETV
jgi:hypothetical protein